MIFKLNSEGFILDWYKATLEEKDEIIKAKDCSSQIQELIPFIGHKCKSHDVVGVFKGIEETWEDYYYIIEQEDGKVLYNTMVDTIEFID